MRLPAVQNVMLNFTPARRLILLLVGLALVSLALVVFAAWSSMPAATDLQRFVTAAGVALGVAALVDWLAARRLPPLQAERQLPRSIAVNREFNVTLVLQHSFDYATVLELYELLPAAVKCSAMPLTVQLQPGVSSRLDYRALALERGELRVPGCRLVRLSRWRLWRFIDQLPVESSARVYPDFSAIAAYSLLATDNHVGQLGIKQRSRRGEGTEFHQLREFRRGDTLRQVDWKATSRRRKPVSRDYTDERDQQVVLLIDSGRRMRAKDDDLSHFDHALNALLLVSYIALRQGDSVGVMNLGGDYRWIPPQKGQGKASTILNGIYDLAPDTSAPDYVAAAERLSKLQSKRSLVVLITNCRDEDIDELNLALQLLRRRHVVLVANLREEALDAVLQTPVEEFEQALEYAGVRHYLAARDAVQKELSSRGILTLDCKPKELAARLANSYLEIKRASLL